VVVSEEIGMGLEQDWNKRRQPKSSASGAEKLNPSQSHKLSPKSFSSVCSLTMCHALLVYTYEIWIFPDTSSSQALPHAALLMSNEVSACDGTRELLGRGGRLQPV